MLRPFVPSDPRHRKIKQIINKPAFVVTIVFLVLFSVALVVFEVFAEVSDEMQATIEWIQTFIVTVLVFELYLRWLVSAGFSKFIKGHWIDISALLPMLRIFRLGRLVLLLRLLRLQC